MPYRDLREFIDVLGQKNLLKRIKTAVSADLEIAEITDRVSKGPAQHNQALLFESVEGFDSPVLINAFGSLGGFVGPYAVGVVRQITGSFAGGLVFLALLLLLAAVAAVLLRGAPVLAHGAVRPNPL